MAKYNEEFKLLVVLSYTAGQQAIPNLLARQFQAERPSQRRVTDVMEFNVRGEKLYLSPVIGIYNGEIVSHTTQKRSKFSLLGDMLKKALAKMRHLTLRRASRVGNIRCLPAGVSSPSMA